jgi:ABC-2 type transport system permease protein
MTVSATPSESSESRPAASGAGAARLPGVWAAAVRLGLLRGGVEIRSFFRQRESVVFTFALPVILLTLFGEIFHGTVGHTGVQFRQYFAAGIIASGIMSTSFVNLGIGVTVDRDDGTLLRLYGTPAPAAAYFIGKAISALVVSLAEVVILLILGSTLLGLHLPSAPGRWVTFAWVFLLAVTTCALLGVAVSSLARSQRSASAVVTLPYLVLSFISGVYFVFTSLPAGLQHVAALFPLKWMCQGLRSVFLPGSFAYTEAGHTWGLDRVALVLAAWLAASLILCVRTFRWQRRA